jgi:hypothetical protein
MSEQNNTKKRAVGTFYPKEEALTSILKLIPKDKSIFNCWTKANCDGIHNDYESLPLPSDYKTFDEDELSNYKDIQSFSEIDVILCCREFGKSEETLDILWTIGKPFIVLLPSQKLGTKYIRKWVEKGLQIVIPSQRIKYDEYRKGNLFIDPKNKSGGAQYDCFYYCYGMNFPRDIMTMELPESKKKEQKEPKPSKAEKKNEKG